MRHLHIIVLLSMALCFGFSSDLLSQDKEKDKSKEKEVYRFTKDLVIKTTPVKNQAKTGTCWCFATVSFLETELLRMGKGEYDLSEMYLVRNTYPLKARNFVFQMGDANFGQGGQAHDVLNGIRTIGLVPEEAYTGMNAGELKHNHGEMVSVLSGMLKGVTANKGGKISPRWMDAFQSVLDVYLGKNPESFNYNGKNYTPASFASELGINPDDYIELTSYTHHPFYEKFRLEIPDNWSGETYYNLPMDELMLVVNHALKSGYSVAWDGDVSEHDFSQKKGYAVVPETDWDDKSNSEKDAEVKQPEKEKVVTQEMRQSSFYDQTSTDDHLMHLVGLAHDQNNTPYYFTKNSWGTDHKNGGYIYMSEQYVKLKTVAIMVHKNALPKDIADKLNIKI